MPIAKENNEGRKLQAPTSNIQRNLKLQCLNEWHVDEILVIESSGAWMLGFGDSVFLCPSF
ncbi:MAG: hypothetical protein DME51_06115 [Verrucomicrobia bacterium]|nr:MAG: hypothetical protein DME51_06115 [Verrucomicrobiota bacterium]